MTAPKRLWIDTDCALGARTFWPRDVDDGYALTAVLGATKSAPSRYEIVGISATAGNTDATTAQSCINHLLLAFHAPSIHVVSQPGAARAISQVTGEFTLLALGPLTNVANALTRRPDLAQRAILLSVGTVLDPRHWRRRLSDLNIRHDPAAARCLDQFASSLVFPLDVIERLVANRDRLSQVEASAPIGAYLANQSARWLRWSFLKHGVSRFPLWDLVAALHAIDALAEPVWDSKGNLTAFDANGSWDNFLKLL